MNKLVFVTGNKNKLRETKAIIGDRLTSHSLDLDEIQGTVEEISIHKAQSAADILQCPVIVEDTALAFDAFGGLPGPYIKWFLKNMSNQDLYDMLAKFDKSAKAICTFAYCEGPGKEVKLFQGIHEGEIVAPRGPPNFGWNPIFKPKQSNKTYAEMTEQEKSKVSHRFLALQKLSKFLDELEAAE